jgi:hypothetical protein
MFTIPTGFRKAEISPDEHGKCCRWAELLPVEDEYHQIAAVCYGCNRIWPVLSNRKVDEMTDADFATGAQRHWAKHHATTPIDTRQYSCQVCGTSAGPLVVTTNGTLCVTCRKAQKLAAVPGKHPVSGVPAMQTCGGAR